MESTANAFTLGFAGRTPAYGVVRRCVSSLFERAEAPFWRVPAARSEMIRSVRSSIATGSSGTAA